MMRLRLLQCLAVAAVSLSAAQLAAGERRESFDRDPGWEGLDNRLVPEPARRTRQDFGHRETRHAGGRQAGEVGGWVQRSLTPAWYGKAIAPRTLDHRLSASGKFAVRRDEGGSGMLFGWFNKDSQGWRTSNSLAFRIDGNGGRYWVLFEYGTRHWLTGGGATFEGDYQTTSTKPFRSDGTVHQWALAYDPAANGGDGEIVFTLDGKEHRAPVLPGHREDGAVFDRFGIFNQQVSGDGMEVYFDDLVIDGEAIDLGRDSGWEGRGNRAEFEDRSIRPLHDFGFSPTSRAGGTPGEVGGIIWRDEKPAYYAARTGPLSLDRELRASGRIAFSGAGSDSAVYLGWFDAAAKRAKSSAEKGDPQRSILAFVIEGPSRIGHYFRPAYRNAAGEGAAREDGPIIRPDGAPHEWSLHYDPDAAGGRGRITFSLDGETQTMDLAPGHRTRGAAFDRFGLFNLQSGGHHVIVHIDEVTYTAD
jgi:hypothetical protein